jgi:hypothetical protein
MSYVMLFSMTALCKVMLFSMTALCKVLHHKLRPFTVFPKEAGFNCKVFIENISDSLKTFFSGRLVTFPHCLVQHKEAVFGMHYLTYGQYGLMFDQ